MLATSNHEPWNRAAELVFCLGFDQECSKFQASARSGGNICVSPRGHVGTLVAWLEMLKRCIGEDAMETPLRGVAILRAS
jgi:hypothetical protein